MDYAVIIKLVRNNTELTFSDLTKFATEIEEILNPKFFHNIHILGMKTSLEVHK